eukprot:Pompholyxophrys_punicea_v1_NODE_612_length_1597_cov_2.242542.p2 type:complete len:143 gc:universal NODE_612_length_1597_cov_2.242542:1020-592(-)
MHHAECRCRVGASLLAFFLRLTAESLAEREKDETINQSGIYDKKHAGPFGGSCGRIASPRSQIVKQKTGQRTATGRRRRTEADGSERQTASGEPNVANRMPVGTARKRLVRDRGADGSERHAAKRHQPSGSAGAQVTKGGGF